MDPRKLHTECGLDERLGEVGCVHCGAPPDTVDHAPSLIFLDNPLPENLPVVPSCLACNRRFSKHEEYLACFLECVIAGTIEIKRLQRPKIQKALQHSRLLAQEIDGCKHINPDGQLLWMPDNHRVQVVVLKLARGHALFELGTAQLDTPEEVVIRPLPTMSRKEQKRFEQAGTAETAGWPEIGSRAFLRAAGAKPYDNQRGPWVVVQAGRYRYSVCDGFQVQIVLSEYLACIVRWD